MGAWSGTPRFLTLADVAEVLNTSSAQVYALVRRGDLPAIKIGGRGQWRVESAQLEEFIQRMYAETRTFVDEHPLRARPSQRPESERGLSRPRESRVTAMVRSLAVALDGELARVSPGWWARIATISAMPSVTRSPSTSVTTSPFSQAARRRPGCRRAPRSISAPVAVVLAGLRPWPRSRGTAPRRCAGSGRR